MQTGEGDVSLLRAVVNSWIAAFNAHDVAALVKLYAEGAELFDSSMKHPRHGRAEIERWFVVRFSTMPTISYTPTNQLFAAEHAIVHWTVHGHAPRLFGWSWLSSPFQVDGVSIFIIHDGCIQQQCGYYDYLSVLEQFLPPLRWLPWRL